MTFSEEPSLLLGQRAAMNAARSYGIPAVVLSSGGKPDDRGSVVVEDGNNPSRLDVVRLRRTRLFKLAFMPAVVTCRSTGPLVCHRSLYAARAVLT
jgi:hypothetical protein